MASHQCYKYTTRSALLLLLAAVAAEFCGIQQIQNTVKMKNLMNLASVALICGIFIVHCTTLAFEYDIDISKPSCQRDENTKWILHTSTWIKLLTSALTRMDFKNLLQSRQLIQKHVKTMHNMCFAPLDIKRNYNSDRLCGQMHLSGVLSKPLTIQITSRPMHAINFTLHNSYIDYSKNCSSASFVIYECDTPNERLVFCGHIQHEAFFTRSTCLKIEVLSINAQRFVLRAEYQVQVPGHAYRLKAITGNAQAIQVPGRIYAGYIMCNIVEYIWYYEVSINTGALKVCTSLLDYCCDKALLP